CFSTPKRHALIRRKKETVREWQAWKIISVPNDDIGFTASARNAIYHATPYAEAARKYLAKVDPLQLLAMASSQAAMLRDGKFTHREKLMAFRAKVLLEQLRIIFAHTHFLMQDDNDMRRLPEYPIRGRRNRSRE